jgi:ATP-dependent RNA helicase DDX35
MDAEQFFDFFNTNNTRDRSKDTATIVSLEGRMYPVDTLYSEKPIINYVEKAIQTIFDIHTKVS